MDLEAVLCVQRDARKARRVKQIVETCDYKLLCSQMSTEDRIHKRWSQAPSICRFPLLIIIHIITL
jgi:hypothetical protein